ncbi:MAG TPA: GNAT family N-acetyltransferase [Thermoanaerobaculia bacterium]|nr:GNAT family N-acetyltransferase [Thermoanaerobaculia bacterium]
MSATTAAYPSHLESDVVLRTGRTLRIRPIRPDDRASLLTFFSSLSATSLRSRFFDTCSPTAALGGAPADVDYSNDFGLVGELGGDIIGVAHYFRCAHRPTFAEVAFTIADLAQGSGIGTRLLERLAEIARENGIERFEADVLAGNQRMLDVFLGSGFEVATGSHEGVVQVSFSLDPTSRFADQSADRSRKAAYASMRSIFAPRSIAVIGASRRPGQLGTAILHNLRTTGFRGSLYAVNPNAETIDSVRSYPSLRAIPDPVELAIVAVPAPLVAAVIDDCIDKGVAAVVVISAGFGETGEEGRAHERRLLEKVRAAGIRMVGPNCMGVINTDPSVNMHGTFASVFPPHGNVAMSSQSGALGLAILDYARSLNIGFSTFVSVGNKADVSGNDLIQYWAEDPDTDVMLLYLESFGNPRRFGEIARRVARKKPIVAVKSGRSPAGARAASSHTGALASSDAIVSDLFRQAGIIRTDTLEEMFDVASVLATQPLPAGRRVGIVTNAGGPGILAADACEANGLVLAPLSDETAAHLRAFLPAAASVGNPVDMIASASAGDYRRTMQFLLADPAIDSVIVVYIPVVPTDADNVAAAIRESALSANGKPLIATFMGASGVPAPMGSVPSFPFPERAVRALARSTSYAEWRRRPAGTTRRFADVDVAGAREIVNRGLENHGGWLDAAAVDALLRAAGIPTPAMEIVRSAGDAFEAAVRIGAPVALKGQGPQLLHKTESNALRLGLANECDVREAYVDLQRQLGDTMTHAIVQKMVSGGVEVMIGVTERTTFGHVLAYGAGGTLVELLSDVAFRIHPITGLDAEDMLAEVRCTRLLRGFRGAAPADIEAVREALARVSALISICPEIQELDLNPVKVLERGAVVVDARIRVERCERAQPSRRIAY